MDKYSVVAGNIFTPTRLVASQELEVPDVNDGHVEHDGRFCDVIILCFICFIRNVNTYNVLK